MEPLNAPLIAIQTRTDEPKQEPSSERSDNEQAILECAEGRHELTGDEIKHEKDIQVEGVDGASLAAQNKNEACGEELEEDVAAEILRSLAASQWRKVSIEAIGKRLFVVSLPRLSHGEASYITGRTRHRRKRWRRR